MYNNSEFCYYSSIVIKSRLPLDYSLDKEQTIYDDSLDALRLSLKDILSPKHCLKGYSIT